MKLVSFDAGSGPMAGVLQADRVVDAAQLLGVRAGLRDVQALLELPDQPLERLKAAFESATSGRPLSEVRLLSPVLRPPTLRDFMVYEGHARVAVHVNSLKPGTGCRSSTFPTRCASLARTPTYPFLPPARG